MSSKHLTRDSSKHRLASMNKTPLAKRAGILRCLTDGMGIRATARAMESSKGTVLRLLADAGEFAAFYSSFRIRGLRCPRLEFDEQHSFVHTKQRRTTATAEGRGDVWTFACLASDSKLVVSWLVGERSTANTYDICDDAAVRTTGITQITTDGWGAYEGGIRRSFGWRRADYARVIKHYENEGVEVNQRRYGPAKVKRVEKTRVMGTPDLDAATTSYIENVNLQTRQKCRRFGRATNAHSKLIDNHRHAVALNFWAHNFSRVHSTLTAEQGRKMTPAMMHGLADRPLTLEWLAEMCDPNAVTIK